MLAYEQMDVLRTLIEQQDASLHPRIIMTMEGSLPSSRIVFTMQHLYYRGNLEGKLLFQQNDGDMAVVRLEQDQLVFIPVGGPSVRFILIHATVTTEDSSSSSQESESMIQVAPRLRV